MEWDYPFSWEKQTSSRVQMATALEYCYLIKPVTKGLINNIGFSLICNHVFSSHEKWLVQKVNPSWLGV